MIKKKTWQENLWIGALLLLGAFVFLTNSPLHIWKQSEAGTDSAVFQTIALMMDNGYMPYKDSFEHKGPIIYIINIIGRLISIEYGVWIIELLSLFLTFIFIYKIARLKCNVFEALITLGASVSLLFGYFEGGNLVEEYAMPCIAVSLYFFLDYFLNEKINAKRLVICGVCLSFVVLLRANMISVWITFAIAVFVQCVADKKYKSILYFLKFFILGIAVVVLPIMIWLIANGALNEFWDNYINFNCLYISEEGGTAVFSAKWNAFFHFLNNTIVIIGVVISALFCRRKQIIYRTYFVYLLLTLWTICLSGRIYGHYAMILVPAMAFPFSVAFEYCEGIFSDKKIGNMLCKLISIYLVSVFIFPSWITCVGKIAEVYEDRQNQHDTAVVRVISEYITNNTTDDEKISVYGNWNIIYIRSNRMHATKYSYQIPIGVVNPEIKQEYWEQMEMELPKLIIVQSGRYDDEIIQFVNSNGYEMVFAENYENLQRSAIVYQRIQK